VSYLVALAHSRQPTQGLVLSVDLSGLWRRRLHVSGDPLPKKGGSQILHNLISTPAISRRRGPVHVACSARAHGDTLRSCITLASASRRTSCRASRRLPSGRRVFGGLVRHRARRTPAAIWPRHGATSNVSRAGSRRLLIARCAAAGTGRRRCPLSTRAASRVGARFEAALERAFSVGGNNEVNAATRKTVLSAGLTVETVGDGEPRALALHHLPLPDLVLMDLQILMTPSEADAAPRSGALRTPAHLPIARLTANPISDRPAQLAPAWTNTPGFRQLFCFGILSTSSVRAESP